MHPALRKGPLFYKKNTTHFPLFNKTPPFHFLPTGVNELINWLIDWLSSSTITRDRNEDSVSQLSRGTVSYRSCERGLGRWCVGLRWKPRCRPVCWRRLQPSLAPHCHHQHQSEQLEARRVVVWWSCSDQRRCAVSATWWYSATVSRWCPATRAGVLCLHM